MRMKKILLWLTVLILPLLIFGALGNIPNQIYKINEIFGFRYVMWSVMFLPSFFILYTYSPNNKKKDNVFFLILMLIGLEFFLKLYSFLGMFVAFLIHGF